MGDLPTRTFGATHPDRDDGPATVRHRRITYRVATAALALLVGSAIVDGTTEVDVWGVSTEHVVASGGGYELEVRYPNVTRPALATPFDFEVRRGGGFDGPVVVAIETNWLEMWDFQALYPEPSSAVGEDDRVVFTFDPPDGDVLQVTFDARIQPSQQRGRDGFVVILGDDDETVVAVDFHTVVLP